MSGAGYEAFGALPIRDGEVAPVVRQLGTGHLRPATFVPAECDWPDAELHNGVAHIEISLHADDTRGAFVHVAGPDRQAVEECWKRVEALLGGDLMVGDFLREVWL